MCGIAGSLHWTDFETKCHIHEMTGLAAHRGPDDFGYAIWGRLTDSVPEKNIVHKSLSLVAGAQVAFGHRRLSILDLSPAGRQPLVYKDRYWITYNGEVYNYKELAQELSQKGYSFSTHTDTEVILAAYDHWGESCLDRFNGMWSFAILDTKEGRLFASRDRFGVKPFYYSVTDRQFHFASEIKQLLPTLKKVEPNLPAVGRFLLYGYVNDNESTCFSEIKQLQPGHSLVIDLNAGVKSIRVRRYYKLPPPAPFSANRSFHDVVDEYKSLLTDAVRLRMRSDVEVGSCLSGGLDSSSIVMTVCKTLGQQKLQTITSRFEETEYDESPYSRAVNRYGNAIANEIIPKMSDIFVDLKKLAWHQDEPFGSTSIFAQWKVMQTAKSINVKVLLDGQGADETLAGYERYVLPYLTTDLKSRSTLSALRSIHGLKSTGCFDIKDSIMKLSLKTLAKAAGYSVRPSLPIRQHLMTQGLSPEWSLDFDFQSRLNSDLYTELQPLLRYEDRNSMAFGIEARTPFLDFRLVEFLNQVPGKYKLEGGWSKSILRHAMQATLPEEVQWRKDKMGFVTPEAGFLRSHFADVIAFLSKRSLQMDHYVNSKSLLQDIQLKPTEYIENRSLWRLISVVAWHEAFEF